MNRKVGIIYSDLDAVYARELGECIGHACGVPVDHAALGEGENFLDAVDRLWDARFLVVLLRAESAPRRWIREQWQQAFWSEPHSGGVHTCCVETAPCRVPELLKARSSLHLYLARGDELRLRRWIIEALGAESPDGFLPAGGLIRECSDADLQTLERNLVDRPGIGLVTGESGSGKTDLAFEFVRKHEVDFEAIWWFACHGLSFAEVVSEAARSAGLEWRGPADDVIAILHREWSKRRCLIVLDGVTSGEAPSLAVRGNASTLITAEDAFVETDCRIRLQLQPAVEMSLSICRVDAIVPDLLVALEGEVDWKRLRRFDRRKGLWRVPGPIRRQPPDTVRHAEAVCKLLRNDALRELLLPDTFIAIRRLLAIGGNWSLTRELVRLVSRALESCGHTTLLAENLTRVTEAAWDARSEVWESTARDLAAVLEDRGQDREAEVWWRRLRSGPAQQLELFPW